MGAGNVRVPRQRPGAIRIAFALLLTMLMLYLLTLNSPNDTASAPSFDASGGERATVEIEFASLEGHFVQLCLCKTQQDARIEAARYIPRGGAGYLLEDAGWHVLGAGYETLAAAQRSAQRLSDAEGLDCRAYSLRAEGVLLRMTGTQGEISALRDADSLLRALFSQMNQAAAGLDNGSASFEQTQTLLAVLQNEAEQAALALQSMGGWQENPVSAGMEALMRNAADALGALCTEKTASTLSFSAQIKYNSIDLRAAHVRFLRELTKS